MALGALLNLGYLTWMGYGIDFAGYNPASLVGLIIMIAVIRVRMRTYESDWEGLWPGSFWVKAAPFIRIGLQSILGLTLLGILLTYWLVRRHDITMADARIKMSEMLYVLNFGASLNFLLFCLFGDWMAVSLGTKLRWMHRLGGHRSKIKRPPLEAQERLEAFEKTGHANTNPEFIELLKQARKEP